MNIPVLTDRECYVKFTGEGISVIRDDIINDAHIEHFSVCGDYYACVCAEEQNILAYEIVPPR